MPSKTKKSGKEPLFCLLFTNRNLGQIRKRVYGPAPYDEVWEVNARDYKAYGLIVQVAP